MAHSCFTKACRHLGYLFLLCFLPQCLALPAPGFLSTQSTENGWVSEGEVFSSLQISMQEVLAGGDGVAAHHLSAIEASIWPTFQALPKSNTGRLAPRAVRYLVRAYFAKEHGWLIRGLEPHSTGVNSVVVQEARILQERAPALVEALLESRQQRRGLSFEDAVAMVASIERLIIYEAVDLLDAAYALNGLSTGDSLSEAQLHEVLTSYLLLCEQGASSARVVLGENEAKKHMEFKVSATTDKLQTWLDLVEFERDSVWNYDFSRRTVTNPFVARQYTFEQVSGLVQSMARHYGKWQNQECLRMKNELVDMDNEGLGRLPLGRFYSHGTGGDDSAYVFAESQDYLRQIGALDDSAAGGPSILIPNYVAGPTNCIATSSYYSVCCLSECEGLLSELEVKVQGPSASADRLLGLVTNLSSSTVDAPRALPEALTTKLREVAARHGGEVPLHGRLFAQWLHYAFPYECPYPQIIADSVTQNALKPSQWFRNRAIAPQDEIQRYINATNESDSRDDKSSTPSLHLWSDEEVLMHEDEHPLLRRLANAVRIVTLVSLLILAFNRAASTLAAGREDKKAAASAWLA